MDAVGTMNWRDRLAKYAKVPGLLEQLSKTAEAMSAPFWWSTQSDPSSLPTVLHNGSICYLHSGVCELGVTANHVITSYLDDLNTYGATIECQFGGSTIAPEQEGRIIAVNVALDLATLSLPSVFVSASNNRRFHHTPVSWPPKRVTAGELVLYGGYPGALREEKIRTVDFPFQWVAGSVADVSPQVIVLEPTFKTLTWLKPEPNATFNRDFRGMSGGPVFRLVEERIARLELVGFIHLFMYEADEDGNSVGDGHTILARHADVIRADGSLAVG
jgi:hypothetical protein